MPVLASDFFMRLARALELTHNIASTPNSIEGLDSLLDPSLVEQAGVATLRKRRLPLEMMLWRHLHGVLSAHVGLGCGQPHEHHAPWSTPAGRTQRCGSSPTKIG